MNLIILAAGTGARLWPLTKNVPKSLLDLGDGRSLLERQIENADHCDEIDKVYVVTGYHSDKIERKLTLFEHSVEVEVIFNPVYHLTNNLLSMWFALPAMKEQDFLVSNGDNIYKKSVLDQVTQQGEGIWVTIDKKEFYDDDDMKVTISEDGAVQRISKNIPEDETHAESVGLVMVKGERFRKMFTSQLDSLVRDKEKLSKFWLETFNALVEAGTIIRTVEIQPDYWAEIDFHPDIIKLRSEISQKLAWRD